MDCSADSTERTVEPPNSVPMTGGWKGWKTLRDSMEPLKG